MFPSTLPWSKYIPFEPTKKQLAFLILPHLEVLFGGAAGGGKSIAVMMAASQYLHIPGYSAIIFRRTLSDANQAGAPLSIAHNWFSGMPGVRYAASDHTYFFDTLDENGNPDVPSRIQFGYIGQQNAFLRYQGGQYQTVIWDEVCLHIEDDYTYMFSRLRSPVCPIHKTMTGEDEGEPLFIKGCPKCEIRARLPLRVRSTGNPGANMEWVKKRFGIIKNPDKSSKYKFIGCNKERPFLPSYYTDNPHLNQVEYGKGLDQLNDLMKAQQKFGDWHAAADARFKRDYFRHYSMRGASYAIGPGGTGAVYPRGSLRIFAVVDPAMSVKSGPADISMVRKQPSYTVIAIFGLTPDNKLLWLDNYRSREEAPEVVEAIEQKWRFWRPEYFLMEENQGRALWQFCQRKGIPVRPLWSHSDKVTNSMEAQTKVKEGKVWLPHEDIGNHWLQELEDELYSWDGHPDRTDDQVDVLSNAVRDVNWMNPSDLLMGEELEAVSSVDDSPGWVY